ncbi:type IV secretory system conjugative DNA transfer family protein [Clostridium perfringens]|nr:type IV secretory system conjugative DNA transfer family protein [Clostridium perfringens]
MELGVIEKIKKLILEDIKKNNKRKNEKFNLKEFLSSNKTLTIIIVGVFILGTLLMNACIGSLGTLTSFSADELSNFSVFKSIFNITYIFKYPLVYFILYILLVIPIVKLVFNIKKSFDDLKDGQKGTSRFTTLEEIKEQYKEIPEKDETYEGGGGVPISRHGDKVYIDTSPVNNLIIGTTRSGKGEMIVVPIIDVYSRAEKKASIIANDPKGELIAMSKETLEQRGYRVECLNLLNPLKSISYNPLQLIIDAYHNGDIDEAQGLCKTLTYSLYYNPSAKDPFWQNSAMSLVNGLILAIIDECDKKCKIIGDEIIQYEKKNISLEEKLIKLTEDNEIKETKENIDKNNLAIEFLEKQKEKELGKITLYTVANMLSELGGKDIQVMEEGKDGNPKAKTVNALDNYFQNLPMQSVAKMQYATSKFADGSARGSIFAVAMDELSRFTMNSVAKMTSRNTINLREIGFNRCVTKKVKVIVKEKLKDNKDIIINKVENFERKNYFTGIGEVEIRQGFEFDDEMFLEGVRAFGCEGEEIKSKIQVDSLDIDTDEIGEYELIYSVTDDTYDNKPVALFLVTPDYDGSNHVLSSIFVRQLYYVLAKEASLSDTGKCEREVIFDLDEFENMPAIEGFANIVTVCLGRGIRFNIVIQALSQLKKLYGEDDKTIIGNCGNIIYILTNDTETAEEISKSLGEMTIVTESRSGEVLDTTKNRTESVDSRRLLMPDELKAFREGEMVVIRVIKRQDLNRNRIVPHPIFNRDETAIKYRWEYLDKDFDNSKVFKRVKIKSKHRNLNLNDLIIDFEETEEKYRIRLNDEVMRYVLTQAGVENIEKEIQENNENNEVSEEDIVLENKVVEKEISEDKKDIKIRDFLNDDEMENFMVLYRRFQKSFKKLTKLNSNVTFRNVEEEFKDHYSDDVRNYLKELEEKLNNRVVI